MIRPRSKKPTLSDKISNLLTVGPSQDPEDDVCEDTRAKTVEDDSDYDDNNDLDRVLSNFRKQNVKLLQDYDQKYQGKSVSRKDIGYAKSEREVSYQSSGESSDETEIEKHLSENNSSVSDDSLENNDVDSDGNEEDDYKRKRREHLVDCISGDESVDEESVESGDDQEASDSSYESVESGDETVESGDDQEASDSSYELKDETEDKNENKLDESNDFKHMKASSASDEVQKGNCVRQQLKMWENLLELRIHSQKILLSANKLPRYEEFKEFKSVSGGEFGNALNNTKKNISSLLNKFLELQNVLLKQYPETKKLNKVAKKTEDDELGEEIPSDTDEEIEKSDVEPEEEITPSKRRKLADFNKILALNHVRYVPYRNNVIQKWHDKTRIASGSLKNKNIVTSTSLIKHIEYLLNDKEKLRKRTQLQRSNYEIITLAKKQSELEEKQPELRSVGTEFAVSENQTNDIVVPEMVCNSEIFDDDDFYHQLLRELIECKSADVSDPVQLSKQWIELQQLRNKMKRKIDTRATKGRKIRYAVHSKLVNYMAPEDDSKWTDEAKTELFGSLFGTRKGQTQTVTTSA